MSCTASEEIPVDPILQTTEAPSVADSAESSAPASSETSFNPVAVPLVLEPMLPESSPEPDAGIQRDDGTVRATDEEFLRELVQDLVYEQSIFSSAQDRNYFSSGLWVTGDSGCLRCDLAPAVAAATLAAQYGDEDALALAVASGDAVLAYHVQPDGSFGPPDTGEGGNDIQTALGANSLGQMLLLLESQLDEPRRQAWAGAVAGAADFLIGNGNLEWYSNGNIVLANTLTMALAYRATGEPRFLEAYEQALEFSISPPAQRWPGYGWVDTEGSLRTGEARAGYFTEKGVEPGFDPEYTMMQANVAARLYLVTGDPRVLSITSALLKQLMPRVDGGDWSFDTSGGTRHTEAVRRVNFDVSALVVLVNIAGRTDLKALVPVDLAARDRVSRQDADCAGKGTYYSYVDLATRLISYSPDLVVKLQGSLGTQFGAVIEAAPAASTRTWQVDAVVRQPTCS